MKSTYLLFLFCVILLGFIPPNGDSKLFNIPERTLRPYEVVNDWPNGTKLQMEDFEISDFVTYAQYKIYLKEIKTDSSSIFYQSQLPDTTMCRKDIYAKYLSSNEYDNYPVLGISWNAAMNYCRWMTLKENKDSIVYLYCLPTCSEWVDSYDYLKSAGIKNDFNKNYSDWLLNSKNDSSGWNSILMFHESWIKDSTFIEDYIHIELKKKLAIGDSYLFKQDKLMNYKNYGYSSNHGYRHIGFRYIRSKIKDIYMRADEKSVVHKHDYEILKYWGLDKKPK
ncbi:MAG TPA: SUMF1/EgtB/PvdO family nonheme iron enzyme [Bacteroidia bacterium]|nr:SUMF1/EgtB/PvdO family nonheme iron enzyme [Bacteroidia bacterium]